LFEEYAQKLKLSSEDLKRLTALQNRLSDSEAEVSVSDLEWLKRVVVEKVLALEEEADWSFGLVLASPLAKTEDARLLFYGEIISQLKGLGKKGFDVKFDMEVSSKSAKFRLDALIIPRRKNRRIAVEIEPTAEDRLRARLSPVEAWSRLKQILILTQLRHGILVFKGYGLHYLVEEDTKPPLYILAIGSDLRQWLRKVEDWSLASGKELRGMSVPFRVVVDFWREETGRAASVSAKSKSEKAGA